MGLWYSSLPAPVLTPRNSDLHLQLFGSASPALVFDFMSTDSFKAVTSLHWLLSFDSHKKLIILSTIFPVSQLTFLSIWKKCTFPVKYWKNHFYLEYIHQAKAGGSKVDAERGCFETLSHSPGRRARGPRALHSHSQFISPHESWPLFA